jgi:hypothetical protein
MVILAQGPSGRRAARSSQKTATVMLGPASTALRTACNSRSRLESLRDGRSRRRVQDMTNSARVLGEKGSACQQFARRYHAAYAHLKSTGCGCVGWVVDPRPNLMDLYQGNRPGFWPVRLWRGPSAERTCRSSRRNCLPRREFIEAARDLQRLEGSKWLAKR